MMNSSNSARMSSSGNNRFPFTPSQWQELEHQALVFKYMVSGMPVPTDLLYTIRRSLDSSISSKFLLHQPHHIGWNGYQVGFGRKIDPEPGRCRRTDGKKWRCSKEAYPDSKYCERHMHRGRNRSRKPVEINNNHNHNHNIPSTTTTTTTTNNVITTTKTATSPPPTKSATESSHFPYPHFTSSKGVTHHHESTTNFFLESNNAYSHSSVKDYRDAMKGESDELLSFGTMRNNLNNNESSWELSPVLTMGSSTLMSNSQMRLHNKADDHQYSSYSGLQSLNDINSAMQQKKHYYNLERDFDDDQQQPTRKVMHHFIDEGPPQKDKDSSSSSSTNWLINSHHHHHHEEINKMASHHKTQLSMSISNPMHDFFMTQK